MTESLRYQKLIEAARKLAPRMCAVTHPCDQASLSAVLEAERLGLFTPILVGPKRRLEDLAKSQSLNISQLEILDTPHSHASADRAVECVLEGRASLLMKRKLTHLTN